MILVNEFEHVIGNTKGIGGCIRRIMHSSHVYIQKKNREAQADQHGIAALRDLSDLVWNILKEI
jgi:hypothetical protein